MGSGQSSISDLSANSYLQRFVKDIPINRDEEFWDEFLSFKFATPLEREDCQSLKESIEQLCSTLAANNKTTGNFTTLVCVSIFYVREMVTNKEAVKDDDALGKCRNALLVIRCCCEYFVEHYSEDVCVAQFNTLPTFEGQPTILEEFLLILSEVVTYIELDETTYYVYLEAVTAMLVLLSSQMFDLKSSNSSKIFALVMKSKCSSNAVDVVRKLIHCYIRNENPPAEKSMVGWAASGIWSFLGGTTAKHKTPSSSPDELHPLASHSLLLLIVLSFHYTKDKNPYRKALFMCKPGRVNSEDTDQSFPLNFKRLYAAICRDLQQDQSVLLLYLMLHKNPSFHQFTLQQNDLQRVVIPILQVLYNAEQQNAHHIYMALIVILILTQEEQFNTVVHDLVVVDSEWFTEKKLQSITLGSLLVVIILRTIQFNMAKMRDKYLHTNCLASLANMSNNFKRLHSYATQKFITLFQQLIKRHARLLEKTKLQQSNATTENNAESEEELSDLAVLEEILHMMIEILNACLCNNIKDNSSLVFALLRDKELFVNFKLNPRFQDIIHNIDSIVTYFGSRVDEKMASIDTSEAVIGIIEEAANDWPKDNIKKCPHLKFKYMEEEAAEEFFVPYIWSIIYKSSFLHWNAEKILLFHAT